ncbi:NAD(P)H-dependent flavin oxidoreductase [Nocardia terpenica]|uniref:2-nitropropane dioxygenase n=1 Tax=Nocardia terpenica TaxID=455432 RepID=A0A164LU67_9NOCA|nr:nitronate monooxygenase [Nocardia terpenica]KZM72746.1 2-nitropropane dioxygenase [Nocardia terpenica]NQE92345.1 nitronate monooxygenase [Nocardia terpenica]
MVEVSADGFPVTAWSARLGLRLPVVNAPMGAVAGGRLAAAVTAAGGLGMIGMGSAGRAAALTRELDAMGAVTPFGIGLVDWVLDAHPDLWDTALAAAPTLLSVSFGTDRSWAARAADAGILTATQVYTVADARRAADAGIDVLVARGREGGGHGDPRLPTRPLLEQVLDAVSVPVLAAGGITSAADVADALAAGASGVWLGTRLAVCPESLLAPPDRAALLAAADTVVTRAFDVALGLGWPARFPARVLRNELTDRWDGHEDTLAADPAARAAAAAAIATGDPRSAPIDAGTGIGAITTAAPAAAVLHALCRGAAQRL